jgi:hypothetical protein
MSDDHCDFSGDSVITAPAQSDSFSENEDANMNSSITTVVPSARLLEEQAIPMDRRENASQADEIPIVAGNADDEDEEDEEDADDFDDDEDQEDEDEEELDDEGLDYDWKEVADDEEDDEEDEEDDDEDE